MSVVSRGWAELMRWRDGRRSSSSSTSSRCSREKGDKRRAALCWHSSTRHSGIAGSRPPRLVRRFVDTTVVNPCCVILSIKLSCIGYHYLLEEAQLSQRDRAALRVIEYFAKSLKVIRNDTVE